jgi:formamidopyrimidine-DNA glycosylase
MSGSLSLTDNSQSLKKHDHVDILFANGAILRYNDPRRFGCIVYTTNLNDNTLLKHLGPEPLNSEFNTKYLFNKLQNKSSTIKQLIMDNTIVVGVGNIYACEALFMAQISPLRAGNSLTKKEITLLVDCIKKVLAQAIELGGSTLRDYKQANGDLGYFQNVHNVYGRSGKNCNTCGSLILEKRLGQRNSFYCNNCQK